MKERLQNVCIIGKSWIWEPCLGGVIFLLGLRLLFRIHYPHIPISLYNLVYPYTAGKYGPTLQVYIVGRSVKIIIPISTAHILIHSW